MKTYVEFVGGPLDSNVLGIAGKTWEGMRICLNVNRKGTTYLQGEESRPHEDQPDAFRAKFEFESQGSKDA